MSDTIATPAVPPAAPSAPAAVPPAPAAAIPNAATPTPPAAVTPPATPPAAAPPAPPAVPEPVVYDLKLPADAVLSKEQLPGLVDLAKKLEMTPKQAQAFVEHQNALLATATKAEADALAKQTAEWNTAIQADPEIGGQNHDAAKANFDRFLTKASPKFVELLKSTGFDGHPEVLRELSRLGKLMGEHGFVKGGNSGGKPSDEEALRQTYPGMFAAAS